MKILVTGASGFVGKAACAQLKSLGHEIFQWTGPNRSTSGSSTPVDIGDAGTFPDCATVSPLDAVVHCAGIAHRFGAVSKEEFVRINVAGVENAVRFAAKSGAQTFVLISSVLVYGTPHNDHPITEDSPTVPDDDYGLSKLKGEQIAIKSCESSSINLSILRPAPIVGEGSRGNISRLIRAINRRRFVWIGDGRNRKTFVYVDDVARAIGEAVSRRTEDPDVFNIVGGTLSVAELVGFIERDLNLRTPKLGFPNWAAKSLLNISGMGARIEAVHRYRRTLESWLADAVFSGERAEQQLGFLSQTAIKEAIRREVDHYLRTK